MLEVRNLCKKYEGKPLLNGVDLTVDGGETLCLIGSSGSGKSTLLRIIAGIESADSGSVCWQGEDLRTVPGYKRNFGLMFQDYALFPHLTVAENVAFGLRMRHLQRDEIEQKVQSALQRVNMTSFHDRRVTDLSGGEQQRIALARTLAPEPRLMMFDEPLAALDRNLRFELQEELKGMLHETGIPTIYVTHDQEEAAFLGDHLALLHEGRIVQYGSPEEVFQYPSSRWVAEFLGFHGFIDGVVCDLSPLAVKTALGVLHPQAAPGSEQPSLGETVTLLIRPRKILLEGEGIGQDQIEGEVIDNRFLGNFYRVEFRLCTGASLEFMSPTPYSIREKVILPLAEEDMLILSQ
ncbi:MAG TPA: ABC transporter ATP-binding protein [Anaerolineaceae bacterium]|nr:ABC transporter ATP-binding protein [Anaerolineaceae bacterium]